LLFLFCTRSYQSNCTDNPPVTLPITDVVLTNGHSVRGVLMTVGSPPQNQSLIPQMYLNNTWIYNTSSPHCPQDQTSRWCETYRGGLYDPDKSSTAATVQDVHAAGGSPSDTDRTVGLHVWDSSWKLDDLGTGNITLDAFPVGIPAFDFGSQYHSQGTIGLGPNSTILTVLKDTGHISSRSYGYWWGKDGATSNAQMDGSLVLGGYDAAKVQGPNTTIALKTPSLSCMSGMHVTITDIVMQFPNSTRSSIVVSTLPYGHCHHTRRTTTDARFLIRHLAHHLLHVCKSTSLQCSHLLVNRTTTISRPMPNRSQTLIRSESIGGTRCTILRLCEFSPCS
jgi:hypothetical protein